MPAVDVVQIFDDVVEFILSDGETIELERL
jgi:hypothetical protein